MDAVPRSAAAGERLQGRRAGAGERAALARVTGNTRVQFKSGVSLRGTGSFAVQFAGKELAATFRSPWPSPSFGGNTLPLDSKVSPEGFEANWQTTEFGSPRITASPAIMDPAMWKGATIAVDLIEATPIYRMITRVAKYGLLFVVLSFATYFFFEVLSRLRIHIVQYGLLGLSLSLFSLLLLSLAEPIGYTNGYLVSAGLVLTQSTLYTAAVARRFKPALAVRRHAVEPVRLSLRAARPRDLFAADRCDRAVHRRVGADGADADGALAGAGRGRGSADLPRRS